MHHQPRDQAQRTWFTRVILCFTGYVLAVAGGLLGYFVHPLLFTALPLGASLCAGLCWRLTRV